MIKTVVFDVGNVLWHFHPAFDGVFLSWAKLMGISLHQFRLNYYEKDGLYRKFETNTLDLPRWFKKISPDNDPKIFLKVMDDKFSDKKYFSHYLNPRVIAQISKLRHSGLPVGCLSNTENYFYPYLKKNILHLFDYQILSWQVGLRKPDPKIYKEIFKHGKFLPSEILFIDDVAVNVAAAHKVGLNAVHYQNVSQLKRDLRRFGLFISPTPKVHTK